jgi:hypothetical protein
MISKLESKHLVIIGKIVSTVLLLIIIFGWTFFLIVVAPVILMIINHGQSKKMSPINLSIFMLPAILCAMLIWRAWNMKTPDIIYRISHPKLKGLVK